MNRRKFLQLTLQLGVVSMLPCTSLGQMAHAMSLRRPRITLPPLPYPENGLEPYLSVRTLQLHHGKHHRGYVNQTNRLLAGTGLQKMPLADIINATADKPQKASLFNNAAQVYNHTFYWRSMQPKGGGAPEGQLRRALESTFGNLDNVAKAFEKTALGLFGSGWVWLAAQEQRLEIMATANADTPLAHGLTPLLAMDVWEHAYYLDYQHRRGDYVRAFLSHLVNWEFAAENFSQAI
jgi:Fe-Mn family superoxide dismutase